MSVNAALEYYNFLLKRIQTLVSIHENNTLLHSFS